MSDNYTAHFQWCQCDGIQSVATTSTRFQYTAIDAQNVIVLGTLLDII